MRRIERTTTVEEERSRVWRSRVCSNLKQQNVPQIIFKKTGRAKDAGESWRRLISPINSTQFHFKLKRQLNGKEWVIIEFRLIICWEVSLCCWKRKRRGNKRNDCGMSVLCNRIVEWSANNNNASSFLKQSSVENYE